MRSLLLILILIVIVGLSVGLYRGWFNVSTSSDAATSNVRLSIDKDKIEADKDSMVDTVQGRGAEEDATTPATEPRN